MSDKGGRDCSGFAEMGLAGSAVEVKSTELASGGEEGTAIRMPPGCVARASGSIY